MKSFYEIKIKDENKNNIIFHSIIFANNEIEAYIKLQEKINAILIEGLEDGNAIIINKRVD